MKKVFLLTTIILSISVCFLKAQNPDSTINTILNEYILSVNSLDAGILVGIIDNSTEISKIYSCGMINKENDLSLVCPASKPAISYMILNKKIDINTTINKWFPTENGYTKSNLITIKMLLSNTSGIADYVGLFEKELKCNPLKTVETAYKNHELAFNPDDSILYSNTNFNIAG
ncbi:MAG: serine hydrolase [Bacteroidales bacterium]|nr:serine hydrolase [Bacteroidales bacterium]